MFPSEPSSPAWQAGEREWSGEGEAVIAKDQHKLSRKSTVLWAVPTQAAGGDSKG